MFGEILSVVNGRAGSRANLLCAVRVAERHGSHVRALHVKGVAEEAVMAGAAMNGFAVLPDLIDSLKASYERSAKVARTIFDEVCGAPPKLAGNKNAWTWELEEGSEPAYISRWGRVSDLIVMTKPKDSGDGTSSESLEEALFKTGSPVLTVPGTCQSPSFNRVAIAWNDSPQSSRAVKAALPFLKAASEVQILVGTQRGSEVDVKRLPGYLEQHGIKSSVVKFAARIGEEGFAILDHTEKSRTELLVMGAYGHTRVREVVLGGATRDVLEHMSTPVLMAH